MKQGTTIEIRWHGRGGQGAVTSAELTALAAIHDGKFAQAFPSFGPERRGAPVLAFNRISAGTPIRVRSGVVEPDIVIVLDPGLVTLINVVDGLKPGGWLIVNSTRTIEDLKQEFSGDWKLAVVDASSIAKELLGVNIVNTTMLGAMIKATGAIKMDSLNEPLAEKFGARAKANFDACNRAFNSTVLSEIRPAGPRKRKTSRLRSLPNGANCWWGARSQMWAIPSSSAPATGKRSTRNGTTPSASSAAYVRSFAPSSASASRATDISGPTPSTARDAASARRNAGPGQLKWLKDRKSGPETRRD